MPKELKELKNFNQGTIYNIDEKDTPDSSNIFSLNLNPMSPGGILDAINIDRLVATLDNSVMYFKGPITNDASNNNDTSTYSYNNSKIHLDDITLLDDSKAISTVKTTSIQGVIQNLTLSNIEPLFEKLLFTGGTNAAIVDNYRTHTTNETFTTNSTYIQLESFSATETVAIPNFSFTSVDGDKYIITLSSTSASNYDTKRFTIRTRDGKTISYIFHNDSDGATGTVDGSGYVRIQLNGLSSYSTIRAQIKAALEDTDGHYNRVNVENNVASNALDITDVTFNLSDFINTGTLFSLAPASGSPSFTGRTGFEIFKCDYYDFTNDRIYVKRRRFGSPTTTLANDTEYFIYAGAITTGTALHANQIRTNAGSCSVSGWLDNSNANFIEEDSQHIGGNGHHLTMCSAGDAGEKAAQGFIDSNLANSAVIYNATTNTIRFGSSAKPTGFKKGDVVTIYHSGGGDNNGNVYRIIGIATSLVTDGWHVEVLDGTMVSETEATDDIYIEANLVKNISFMHASNSSGATVSDTVASWTHSYYYNDSGAGLLYNYYGARGANNLLNSGEEVALVASGGIWDDATGNTPYTFADASTTFYPFGSGDHYIKIISEYDASNSSYFTQGDNSALLVTDKTIEFNNDMTYELAYNDFITFESSTYDGSTEYMRVKGVNGKFVDVERGVLGSTIAQMSYGTGNKVTKNLNHHIHQSIDASLLKPGQSYKLNFYAKSEVDVIGALAVVYNGGYFNSNSIWRPFNDISNPGLLSANTPRPTNGEQWVEFSDITTPDSIPATASNLFGVDTVWRKYEFEFRLPKNLNTPQELNIKFANRGKEGQELYLDLVTLIENNYVHAIGEEASHATSLSLIDNEGSKSLVLFDSVKNTLSAVENFNLETPTLNVASPDLSPFGDAVIKSSNNTASYALNNREVHIGFGSKKSDTSPQWLGYINHKVFGKDYTDNLYQDEDVVHRYDAKGVSRMSKMTVAGEHEYLPATWDNTAKTLDITHTAHSMTVGDNIVIREWEDTANNWTGAGVWVVTSLGGDLNSIICKRFNTLDKDPTDENFLATSGTNDRDTNTGRVCYRPYYYYGMKVGVPKIFRIVPSDRITDGGGTVALDTDILAGEIQVSPDLPFIPTSITTCHNKVITGADGTKGTGGGKIYALDAENDRVAVIDIQVAYNQWDDTALTFIPFDLHFKSFKWSNDNVNGNIGGDTEVYPGAGLADLSTPSIQYAGVLSDILETKGTNASYIIEAVNQEDNEPHDFDTRLWIQCAPEGTASFTEGNRFLFCGLTNATNTGEGGQVFAGDRTPPTTSMVSESSHTYYGSWSPNDNVIARFHGAPGVNLIDSDDSVRKYGYYASTGANLYDIVPVYDGENAGTAFGTSNGTRNSYYRFGYNVGWDCGNESDVNPLAIYVAKYGLFQMADNDCDGMIDGTGVVCANSISLGVSPHYGGTVGGDRTSATLPYGRHHRRVTSHVVGLLGKSENEWVAHWGQFFSKRNENRWQGPKEYVDYNLATYMASFESGLDWSDAPWNKNIGVCIFVCSDIHLGDIYPDFPSSSERYYRNHDSQASVADNTGTTDTTYGMKVQMLNAADVTTLQPGDTVYCYDDGDGTKSFVTYIAGIEGDDTIILPLTTDDAGVAAQFAADDLCLMPHSIIEQYHQNAESNKDIGGTKIGSCLAREETIYHYTYDNIEPLNGSIFTEGVGCGKYTRTWITPSGTEGFDGNDYLTNFSTSAGLAGNPYRPGFTTCIEKLNYRAGYMIRPIAMGLDTFNQFRWGENLCIDSPTFPEPVFHTQNGDYLHYSIKNTESGGEEDTKNFYSSKVFLSSDKDTSIEAESVIFLLDLTQFGNDMNLTSYYISPVSHGGWESSQDYNVRDPGEFLLRGRFTSLADRHVHDGNNDAHAIMRHETSHNWRMEVGTDYCPIVKLSHPHVSGNVNPAGYGGGPFRRMGAYAGAVLVLRERYSRTCHTRYILNSWDTDRTTDHTQNTHLQLHYPLPFQIKQYDTFEIWAHHDICTAPAFLKGHPLGSYARYNAEATVVDPYYESRVYHTDGRGVNTLKIVISSGVCTTYEQVGEILAMKVTPHNLITGDLILIEDASETLDGVHSVVVTGASTFTSTTISDSETGTCWYSIVNEDGKHAKSNPLTLPLRNPVFKTMFGGLDMRKLKSYATEGTDITGSSPEAGKARVDVAGDHLLVDGDTVTMIGGTQNHRGTYFIDKHDGDEFDIISAAATDSNAQTITTNQWEAFLIEGGGTGRMGELRAGLSAWDKGNIVNNIIRHDTDNDADKYIKVLGANLAIVGASAADVDGDYFLKNTSYTYKVSLMYDGYQEGVLSQDFWVHTEDVTRNKLSVTINIDEFSKRLSHVCLYRRDAADQFFSLVKEIPTNSGWIVDEDGVHSFRVYDKGDLLETYESRTGLSEVLDTTNMKYGISAEVSGYLFVGDCSHERIEHASNQIFRSRPGQFSLFDYANDNQVLKSKPTAMAGFLGRLFVFDDNHIYKINPETLEIEDIFEGIGCSGQHSVVVTEYGLFFANKYGAYKHDGMQPIKISNAIDQGGSLSKTKLTSIGNFSGFNTDNFSFSWDKAVSQSLDPVNVTYDTQMSSALFFFKLRVPILENVDVTRSASGEYGDDDIWLKWYIWSFNLIHERWDLWELSEGSIVGAPIVAKDGEVLVPVDNAIYELHGGSSKRKYSWISKKISAGQDSVLKIFKKVKLGGADNNMSFHTGNEFGLKTITNSTTLSTGMTMTYVDADLMSEYKITSSDKKGLWIQLSLRNMGDSVDSIGVIFRRQRVK